VEVTDTLNNKMVYTGRGEFQIYQSLKFKMDAAGKVTYEGENKEYENSWERFEEVANYPQSVDQYWPGLLPTVRGSLNVNIKFDKFPQNIKWTFQKRSTSGAYTTVASFDGAVNGIKNDLVVTELPAAQLGEGWYKFKMTDSSNDGICCNFRRGWAAVTGYLRATRKAGMVWGDNGEFGSGVEIYIKVDARGFVERYTDNASVVS
jgi:hypothetical protein